MEHRADWVSRVLEEEIRHPTRRRRVFGVGTRVRPLEPSDLVILGRFRAGVTGWVGGRFIWTALYVCMYMCVCVCVCVCVYYNRYKILP